MGEQPGVAVPHWRPNAVGPERSRGPGGSFSPVRRGQTCRGVGKVRRESLGPNLSGGLEVQAVTMRIVYPHRPQGEGVRDRKIGGPNCDAELERGITRLVTRVP